MSISLIEQVIRLDEDDNLHSASLLILLHTLMGKKSETKIDITKLAKLDFLLNYPAALEWGLKQLNKIKDISISDAERNNIETKLLIFRYSPWSSDFRRLLLLLDSRRLISWRLIENHLEISLTIKGFELVELLSYYEEFKDMTSHSKVIKTNFYSLSVSNLNIIMSIAINELSMA